MLNKYQHIVGKINYFLFVLALCSLPYPTRISLYLWVTWMICWLLEGRFLCKQNLQWHKGLIPLLMVAIWVAWEAVSCIWAVHKTDATNMLGRHVSLIAILPIALWGVNDQYNWTKAFKWFIVSSVASIFIYGIYIYFIQNWAYLQEHHQLPTTTLQWSYFGEQISDSKHRLYYGTVLNLAIVALLYLRIPLMAIRRHHKVIICCFLICLFALVAGIILSGSRANMLTLVLIGAMAIIQSLRGKRRLIGTSMVVVIGIALAGLLFTQHPRFEKLEWEHIAEREDYKPSEIEPRINIWYCALQNPKDYIWYGVGAGGNSEYLKTIYQSHNWTAYYDRGFNTHNQYFGVLINLGIFAAILFLLIWLLYPMWYKDKLRSTATLVATIIGSNMLTENMLDRIDGVIITSLAIITIALLSRVQRAS